MADNLKGDAIHFDMAHRPPRQSKLRNHCRRCWWVWLASTIIAIVVIVIVIIFAIIPKVAQSKIDQAELTIQGITVSNTQSQNYTMAINSTITTDGKVHAKIDAFEGVMYLEDLPPQKPFAVLQFPESESAALQTFNISQFTPIHDMEAFTTFNSWLLANDSLRVTVKGDTNVHISGLSKVYPVTFQKTVTLTGLSKFNGTTVQDIKLNITGFEDGTEMHGTTTIPNRSIVTFEIGNATFINYILGEEVGEANITNVIIKPGLNTFNMTATVDPLEVVSVLGKRPYCETGILPTVLRGKAVFNHGQPLSYFADALASENQTVPLNLKGPFEALNLPLKCDS